MTLEQPGQGNLSAVGARVEATTEDGRLVIGDLSVGSTGTMSARPSEVHLGLGASNRVDLRVRWPDGTVTRNLAVPTRRSVHLVHP